MPHKYSKKPQTIKTEHPNAKYLVIVESPSKCAKIEHFLGLDYCCIASKGHLRHIEGLKSIDTKNNYEPRFSILEEKQDHVTKMKPIVAKFAKQNIILATDDDREGEAIAWHICMLFDLPVETTRRILFHEITKVAIIKAIENPTKINMDLVKAQHSRQVLDIIVGYKVSPFLWKYLYNNKENSLSAGRCQTPALRLVYENEKEKEKIGALELSYKTTGTFFSKNIVFTLNNELKNQEQVLDFMEKSRTWNHKLRTLKPKPTTKGAPKPFHTSNLLQTASSVLHMSPKETMSLCQNLYQAGYITYMRTESSQYSKTFLEQVNKYILKEFKKPEYLGDFNKLENKDSTNPHEAIRVTQLEIRNVASDENQRLSTLYKLIWRNTLESCMATAKYLETDIIISAPTEYEYKYTIETPTFLGWKKVNEKKDSQLEENQSENNGLDMYFKTIENSKQNCQLNKVESVIVGRNKHKHYTEASLIHKLETLGIGRPSTFASIVDTIQERGYVKKMDVEGEKIQCKEFTLMDNKIIETIKERTFDNEKGKLLIQPIGIITIEFLINYFESMFSYEYTKQMEDKLDTISMGNMEWSLICKECDEEIKNISKPITKLAKQTYSIETGYELLFERYGPVIKHTLEKEEIEYLPVKKEVRIDLDKLKEGGYTLEDLIEINNKKMGEYEGKEIYLKTGRYGHYVEWGDKKESIKGIEKPIELLTIEDIKLYLESKTQKVDKNILRVLNKDFSVRKGKFGAYVFYKRTDMAKPEFLNIKKFPEGFFACEAETLIEWLIDTYNLPNQ
jgi:DNA topoisomerase-1